MSHDRLAQLMQARREAMEAHPEDRTPHETILSILHGLDANEITLTQALRLLGYQALRLDDPSEYQALYRQAAAEIRQMQREAR